MSSNYALYIMEREGKHILEDEKGFATYLFTASHCYIEDIYVRPEYRKSNVASSYADQISQIARKKGYTKLLGSVCPQAFGAAASTRVLLAYGFELLSSEKNIIYFEKSLEA
jgi:GNAT superfamily N-acetyltransferase